MQILGIESSCDDTSVAIVTEQKDILAHVSKSQIEQHAPYGGVVPEIASRAHMDILYVLVKHAMKDAKLSGYQELDAIAVTAGPGLIGGLIVGVMVAKGIAHTTGLPLIGVNHLEGHALTVRLTHNIAFPYLCLLVSGGHCQFLIVHDVNRYTKLGGTIDDALGEAFDKVAKMLGLGYPGGPAVEEHAKKGNPNAFDLPQPLRGKPGCDFSFSGLKTAVKRIVDQQEHVDNNFIHDICASFQTSVGLIITNRMLNAITLTKDQYPDVKHFVLAGGVAANQYINNIAHATCKEHHMELVAPPINLCTDNGAMIAWAGMERFQAGMTDPITLTPKARWPLETLS